MKMTKKIISLLLSVIMVLGVCAVAPVTVNAADDGIVWKDAEQRYEISDYDGLRTFAEIVNGEVNPDNLTNPQSANAILTADIDASVSNPDHPDYDAETNDWTPIGKDSKKYTGTFDGDGHKITGLTYNKSLLTNAGLFGYVQGVKDGDEVIGGIVKNVGLEGGSITGKYSVGGVIGYNFEGTITNCYNTGDVSGDKAVGGVVGYNSSGTVTNCYNTGNVSCNEGGGVVGYNNGTVTNCYNTGDVLATSSGAYVGGVIGYFNRGEVTNCYYDRDRCALSKSIGNTDDTDTVKGLTTDQMTGSAAAVNMKGLFADDGSSADWCITDSYPRLIIKIGSYAQLKTFASRVNGGDTGACAVLTADIDASASETANAWTPIGNGGYKYTGIFDGDGHIITGLTFNETSADFVGLFGYVGSGGKVQNVGLEGGSITGGYHVGGVVGFNNTGTVINCHNTGDVSGSNMVGGVVGENYGSVTNCYNTGDVSGSLFVGGVAGYNEADTITNCYNTGAVFANGNYAGGVVAENNDGAITNCYNTGAVSGSGNYVGGIAGFFMGGLVTNCYNTGRVSGAHRVGGIIGVSEGINDEKATVTNCFYDSDIVTGVEPIGYERGDGASHSCVKGLTTAQMTGVASNDDNTMKALFNAVDDNGKKVWLDPKADGTDSESGKYYWYYPHLKGFNFNDDLTQKTADEIEAAYWPAKVEVSVAMSGGDTITYDGEDHKSDFLVIVGDTSVPEGTTSVTYFKYSNGSWPEEGTSDVPLDAGTYKMKYTAGEETAEKVFTILSPGADYKVSCSVCVDEDHDTGEPIWSTDPVNPVGAGNYKAVVTFLKSVVNDEEVSYLPDDGHAPIEKEFTITPKPLISSDITIEDIADVKYNGRAQAPEVTVTDGEKSLVKGKDYIVSYSGNVDVARDANGNVIAGAKAIVTGKGNYTGIVEKPFKITPKEVTITADNASKIYDGSALTQNEFTASALEAGDTHEFTVAMTPDSTITDYGTQPNVIAMVDGVNVTAGTATPVGNYTVITENGTLTVAKATATVIITGHYNSAPYDGKEHSVSGYTATAGNNLYDVTKDFTFSGTAEANRTDAGTTNMGLNRSQFTNINPNFDVTFNVTDGYQTIVPLNVEVTITGNSATADYDGQEHSASGYTFAASNPLYKEGDFTFSGTAEAKLTEPGTQNMGLDASQFTNTNTNFDTVTFVIAEDGKITVNPVIKFVNEDGTVLQSSAYAMGETPEYKGETPTKAASDGCTYEFAGWTPAITEVTGNATYTAVYTSTAVGLELKDDISDTTGYKEDQTFTVDTSNLPEGAEVHWFLNGEDVGTGSSYTVEDPTEDYTIQAKVIDKDGNVIAESETAKVHVKNGFFDRLKAFFAELIEKILGKAIADLLSSVC